MCVISDKSGVLGLGGIIGGTRSGTELKTENILFARNPADLVVRERLELALFPCADL